MHQGQDENTRPEGQQTNCMGADPSFQHTAQHLKKSEGLAPQQHKLHSTTQQGPKMGAHSFCK
jgi:hypothetical protein